MNVMFSSAARPHIAPHANTSMQAVKTARPAVKFGGPEIKIPMWILIPVVAYTTVKETSRFVVKKVSLGKFCKDASLPWSK